METEQVARICRALGDPTRVQILRFLLGCGQTVAVDESGEVARYDGATVGEVCCHVTGSEKVSSTISFHLKELRLAGLIRAERRGRYMICRAEPDVVLELADLLRASATPAPPTAPSPAEALTGSVRRSYGAAALRVLSGEGSARCCGGSDDRDPITSELYEGAQLATVPEAARLASLGCGNPTALAALNPGEVVVDLGSGGGIDVLLSARRVGPTGFAYGVDMTDEMLELAERSRIEAGAENVRFLKGGIDAIPLPDATADVVISNCVINLAADKDEVLREAFRVLKPGGRFAVSDVVTEGDLPDAVRQDMALYVGCVAGALRSDEYVQKLQDAGFVEAAVEPIRRYRFSELEGSWAPQGVQGLSNEEKRALDGRILGAFIRAVKPRGGADR